MYTSIQEFIGDWTHEAGSTQKVFDALTDASLQQMVSAEDRSLGKIAWHIVTSTSGMLSEFGLKVEQVENANQVPDSAKEIADTFRKVTADTMEAVKQWSDSSLSDKIHVFGREMAKAVTLDLLIKHLIHHRGQITVLMRQAGVKVPGIYGPAREEWSLIGMEAPSL
ncbi:DinB family protein [Bacillus sp. JJ1764]|uniref:DinB family protein n=1 Tax=Bacillus sp. JJ1764 TaxID=3122964 RepID=UPI002FFD93B0